MRVFQLSRRHEYRGRGARLGVRLRHRRRRRGVAGPGARVQGAADDPRSRLSGPHLTSDAGVYASLDFIEIGVAEKLERNLPFLLIVTEVDLSSH